MGKFETVQIGKTVSVYGGVGSLIQTRDNGSLIINEFDKWKVYTKFIAGREPEEISVSGVKTIEESRLLKLLHEKGFEALKLVFAPPVNKLDGFELEKKDFSLSAEYFPKWFFCPYCRHLHHIESWRSVWNDKDFTRKTMKGATVKDEFDGRFPRCHYCRTTAENKNSRKKTYLLEQVRFVLASEDSGEIMDIPWDQYVYYKRSEGKEFIIADGNRKAAELLYSTSAGTADLFGIQVKEIINGDRGNIGARKSLGDILSLKFRKGNSEFRAVSRSGSNLYFAHTLSSIFVPINYPGEETINRISDLFFENPGITAVEIRTKLKSRPRNPVDVPEEMIQRLINANFEFERYKNEIDDFRKEEIEYITSNEGIEKRDLVSLKSQIDLTSLSFIKGIYSLRKLKETVVQTGYTRISDGSDKKAKLRATSTIPQDEVRYIPGVENYGEGVLLEFDKDKIAALDCKEYLHTFSHMLMKELEFECGYSLTSLKERLYCIEDEENKITKLGVLIYSINGADGSFGGITSLIPHKIKAIISNAFERARDCPNDPICESEGGHCFACLDIPEISCDGLFNKQLNRFVVIHSPDHQ